MSTSTLGQQLLGLGAWVVGGGLTLLALTYLLSSLILGALIGAGACANNPKCRTSALRGTEAIFGLGIAVWAGYLWCAGVATDAFAAEALYRCVALFIGLDAAWMLLS